MLCTHVNCLRKNNLIQLIYNEDSSLVKQKKVDIWSIAIIGLLFTG